MQTYIIKHKAKLISLVLAFVFIGSCAINPVTGNQGEMVINATWGLGEPLVSGKVNPDEVVVDTATRIRKSTTVGNKELVLNASGSQVTNR